MTFSLGKNRNTRLTPLPVSQVPAPMQEDIANYGTYQKHVQRIVKQWLMGKRKLPGPKPKLSTKFTDKFSPDGLRIFIPGSCKRCSQANLPEVEGSGAILVGARQVQSN